MKKIIFLNNFISSSISSSPFVFIIISCFLANLLVISVGTNSNNYNNNNIFAGVSAQSTCPNLPCVPYCQNGGFCNSTNNRTDTQGQYFGQCDCVTGFSGSGCELAGSICLPTCSKYSTCYGGVCQCLPYLSIASSGTCSTYNCMNLPSGGTGTYKIGPLNGTGQCPACDADHSGVFCQLNESCSTLFDSSFMTHKSPIPVGENLDIECSATDPQLTLLFGGQISAVIKFHKPNSVANWESPDGADQRYLQASFMRLGSASKNREEFFVCRSSNCTNQYVMTNVGKSTVFSQNATYVEPGGAKALRGLLGTCGIITGGLFAVPAGKLRLIFLPIAISFTILFLAITGGAGAAINDKANTATIQTVDVYSAEPELHGIMTCEVTNCQCNEFAVDTPNCGSQAVRDLTSAIYGKISIDCNNHTNKCAFVPYNVFDGKLTIALDCNGRSCIKNTFNWSSLTNNVASNLVGPPAVDKAGIGIGTTIAVVFLMLVVGVIAFHCFVRRKTEELWWERNSHLIKYEDGGHVPNIEEIKQRMMRRREDVDVSNIALQHPKLLRQQQREIEEQEFQMRNMNNNNNNNNLGQREVALNDEESPENIIIDTPAGGNCFDGDFSLDCHDIRYSVELDASSALAADHNFNLNNNNNNNNETSFEKSSTPRKIKLPQSSANLFSKTNKYQTTSNTNEHHEGGADEGKKFTKKQHTNTGVSGSNNNSNDDDDDSSNRKSGDHIVENEQVNVLVARREAEAMASPKEGLGENNNNNNNNNSNNNDLNENEDDRSDTRHTSSGTNRSTGTTTQNFNSSNNTDTYNTTNFSSENMNQKNINNNNINDNDNNLNNNNDPHSPTMISSDGKVHRKILKGINLSLKSGHFIGMLGGSGHGKSTLLDILANRPKTYPVEGRTTLDGVLLSAAGSLYNRVLSYVGDEDSLLPTQTVLEALHFSCDLRLPVHVPQKQKNHLVEHTVSLFGLKRVANNIIGTQMTSTQGGLSHGERRRLNLAVLMMSFPHVLICDEAVSGLDSYNAKIVVSVLKEISRGTMTRNLPYFADAFPYRPVVVLSIHQPNDHFFKTFDDVLLLAQGHLLYSGPVREMEGFFHNEGLLEGKEADVTMADFALELACTLNDERKYAAIAAKNNEKNLEKIRIENRNFEDDDDEEDRDVHNQEENKNNNSKKKGNNNNNNDNGGGGDLGGGDNNNNNNKPRNSHKKKRRKSRTTKALSNSTTIQLQSDNTNGTNKSQKSVQESLLFLSVQSSVDFYPDFVEQVGLLVRRGWLNLTRRPVVFSIHYLVSTIVSLVISAMYSNSDKDVAGTLAKAGLVTFFLLWIALTNMSALDLVIAERPTFIFERAAETYSTTAYFLSKIVLDFILLRIIPTCIGCTLFYFPVGFRSTTEGYGMFILIGILFSICTAGMSIGVATFSPNFAAGILFNTLCVIVFFAFGGLISQSSAVPASINWIRYFSPFSYAFEAVMVNDLADQMCFFTIRGPSGEPLGTPLPIACVQFLYNIGINPNQLSVDVSLLAVWAILYLILSYLCLHFIARGTR